MNLTHFLVVLAVLGLILTGKPVWVTGKGPWGTGTGWPCIPQGYLCYSLAMVSENWVNVSKTNMSCLVNFFFCFLQNLHSSSNEFLPCQSYLPTRDVLFSGVKCIFAITVLLRPSVHGLWPVMLGVHCQRCSSFAVTCDMRKKCLCSLIFKGSLNIFQRKLHWATIVLNY